MLEQTDLLCYEKGGRKKADLNISCLKDNAFERQFLMAVVRNWMLEKVWGFFMVGFLFLCFEASKESKWYL